MLKVVDETKHIQLVARNSRGNVDSGYSIIIPLLNVEAVCRFEGARRLDILKTSVLNVHCNRKWMQEIDFDILMLWYAL